MTCMMGQSARVPPGAEALPMWCDVCGTRVELVLPVSIDALATLSGAFEKRHARCGQDEEDDDDG